MQIYADIYIFRGEPERQIVLFYYLNQLSAGLLGVQSSAGSFTGSCNVVMNTAGRQYRGLAVCLFGLAFDSPCKS